MTTPHNGTSEPDDAPLAPAPPSPVGIRPVETVLAVAGFILLCVNVWADVTRNDYEGGLLSVALLGFIGVLLGKNAGSIIGGGK